MRISIADGNPATGEVPFDFLSVSRCKDRNGNTAERSAVERRLEYGR
ncbi:MAG: hypothetical protein FWD92_01270 [Methanomassiliicoccaceae archaeon]|nr:hypothetical protein [Methanomassiliicoccaceae archaeon]